MKKITLQWRITLLTAIVLAVCTGMLTVYSILNAQNTFFPMVLLSLPVEIQETTPGQPAGDLLPQQEDIDLTAVPAEDRGADMTEDMTADKTADMTTDMTEAVRMTEAVAAKRSYDSRNIIFCVLIVAVGTAAVYLVTGRALRPVRMLSKEVSSINEFNLSAKLPEAASQDEVGELTRGCNRMLSRLEDAFARQKRFTASAAHELKTPLAIMKAGIQVLSIDDNTTLEEYKDNAQVIENSIDRLAQVVEDLLLLASAGERSESHREKVEAGTLCEAVCCELEPLYEERNIKCKINVDHIMVDADPSLLYRAFFNLIENAYKYNRQDGKIYITGRKEEDCDLLIIEDTGHGIDDGNLPLIFEAFYRVDNSRSRRVAGAGLGLSIVKAIIEQYGGKITVESKLGSGSKFTITFPSFSEF